MLITYDFKQNINFDTGMNISNSKYNLIIFDCDGTIVDSEAIYSRALSKTLISIGHPEYTIEHCVDIFTGLSLPKMIEYLDANIDTGFSAAEILRKLDIVTAELDRIHLKPIDYAHELIKQIPLKMCVASNGERDRVLKALETTKLKQFFHHNKVFTYDQVLMPKPAPDLFLYAAKKMKSPPEKCLVIEDSVVGIKAAKAANMKVIAFTGATHNNPHTLQHVHDAKPDHIVRHLSEVINYI